MKPRGYSYNYEAYRRIDAAYNAIAELLDLPMEDGVAKGLSTEGSSWICLSPDVAERLIALASSPASAS